MDSNAELTDGASLEELRARIDDIDRQIVGLLNERASISLEVGKAKASERCRVYVPDREIVVYSHILSLNGGPLSDAALKNIYDQIMQESRNLQARRP